MIPVPRRARISEAPGLSNPARSRITLADFARCTVDRKPSQVAMIAAQPAEKLNGGMMAKAADDDCLSSGQLRMKPMLMRGALFVELYRRRERATRQGDKWSLPAVAFDEQAQVDPTDADLKLQIGLLSFASCVIQHDPAVAKAIVLAPTAGKEQDAAIATLAPHLGQCLPGGQKITLGKTFLEGALAEVLYRGTVSVTLPMSQEAK